MIEYRKNGRASDRSVLPVANNDFENHLSEVLRLQIAFIKK
jgi:hypothetical protein